MEILEKQLSFIREADRLKEVLRQTWLADGSRQENDAEHSWHMALMCALLSEYANKPINVGRTMLMILIHDLIEIDAGDTYAYDTEGYATKAERERKAADRIFALLPEDQAVMLRSLWEEFEAGETPEAKFANAMDRMQPVLLNDASGGTGWIRHGVYVDQVKKRTAPVREGSEALWTMLQEILRKNVEAGLLRKRVWEQESEVLNERHDLAAARLAEIGGEELAAEAFLPFVRAVGAHLAACCEYAGELSERQGASRPAAGETETPVIADRAETQAAERVKTQAAERVEILAAARENLCGTRSGMPSGRPRKAKLPPAFCHFSRGRRGEPGC